VPLNTIASTLKEYYLSINRRFIYDITEILLKVALNTIASTLKECYLSINRRFI
jgi:Arc/MetJ family transcription regulator